MEQSLSWLWALPMASGGVCLTTALQLWQLRKEPYIKLLMLTMGLLALWAVANALLTISPSQEAKAVLYTIHGDVVVVLSFVFYFLARLTTDPGYRPGKTTLLVLSLGLFAFVAFSFTMEFRQLIFREDPENKIFLIPGMSPRPACWALFFALPYAMFAYNISLFARALPGLSKKERHRTYSFLSGIVIIGLVSALYYFFGLTPVQGFDPTPSSVGVAGALALFSSFYFRDNWAELTSLGGDVKHLDVKFFTYRVAILIVIPAGFVFSTLAFLKGGWVLGTGLVLMLAVIIVGFVLMQESLGSARKERIFTIFFSTMTGIFGLVIAYTLGRAGEIEKMPWAFLFPVVAIHGLGPVAGLAGTAVFLSAIALAVYLSGNASLEIHSGLWLRFFLSAACLTIIMCFMELARRKYLRLLINSEEELRRHRDSLEELVGRRTLALNQTVAQLQQEAEQRKRYETALLEAKEAAETANQAKTDFLANMSHELRTPLTPILGFSDILRDEYAGPLNEQQKEYLGYIVTSSRHLHSLINDLLDMTNLEASLTEVDLKPASLRDIIYSVVIAQTDRAAANGVELRMAFNQLPGEVWLDSRGFKRVMNILVANAIKFSPGGVVTLEAWGRPDGVAGGGPAARGAWIEVMVSDNGIGLDPENMERIFQPFEQVDPSISRRFDGSGLGLALARRLVDLQNGRLWAESDGLGKGSRFRLAIPWRTGPEAQ